MRLIIESDGPARVHLETDDGDTGEDAGTGYSHEVGGVHVAADTPAGFQPTASPGTPYADPYE